MFLAAANANAESLTTGAWVLLVGIVWLSLSSWLIIASRWRHGVEILAAEPRRPVPWAGRYVAFSFVLFLWAMFASLWITKLVSGVPWDVALPQDDFQIQNRHLGVVSIGFLLVAVLTVVFLRITSGARAADIGWRWRLFLHDAAIGLLAFGAAAPFLYLLMLGLTLLWPGAPTHPIVEMVRDDPTQGIPIWAIVAAVLVAPIAEEILFRVVFQGWLERVFVLYGNRMIPLRFSPSSRNKVDLATWIDPTLSDDVGISIVSGSNTAGPSEPLSELFQNPPMQDGQPSSGYPHQTTPADDPTGILLRDALYRPGYQLTGPILLTSILFALFHFSHGPAPIPLFVFSIILGYLYQRTHRLVPCIAAHMALNATSMTFLYLQL